MKNSSVKDFGEERDLGILAGRFADHLLGADQIMFVGSRTPQRATNICAFLLTLTYMDVADGEAASAPDHPAGRTAKIR